MNVLIFLSLLAAFILALIGTIQNAIRYLGISLIITIVVIIILVTIPLITKL